MKHIPNILTILRLLACPLIIYLFIFGTVMFISAKKILIVFAIASLTDFFDGYLARKGNFKSNFGKILDPIADKALIITMFVMIIIYGDFNKFGFLNIPLFQAMTSNVILEEEDKITKQWTILREIGE